MTATWKHGDQLRDHLRFQQLVFKFAKDSSGVLSGNTRTDAARIIADLGWEDGEPLLELMLQDDDLRVREAGAQALAQLTGKPVEVRRPDLAFPHAADHEDLVLLASTSRGGELRGRLDTWFDGRPALIMGSGTNLEARDDASSARDILDPGFDVSDYLSLPVQARSPCWVFLASEAHRGSFPEPAFAVCVDAARHELWRYAPVQKGIETMCRLYDAAGCVGIAFGPGGDEGVVAFDPDGHELFRVPHKYVTYGLSSNPQLPDIWLHCGGSLELYDNRGQSSDDSPILQNMRAARFYASTAVLAADATRQPTIVAAGSGVRSVPTIQCLDADLNVAWTATLPDRVTSLALLEPPGRAALCAATTAGGDLLVFDLDGGLHQRLAMPHKRPGRNDDVATYSISVGPLSDGGYGLAIGLLSSTLLYAVK